MIIFDTVFLIMRLQCDRYTIDFWIELKIATFDQVDYIDIEPEHLSKPNILLILVNYYLCPYWLSLPISLTWYWPGLFVLGVLLGEGFSV